MLSSFLMRLAQRLLPHILRISRDGIWAMESRFGVVFFTIEAKFTLHTLPSRRPYLRNHLRKLNQILPTEGTSAGSNSDKWIRWNRIRPTRWQRAQCTLSILEVDTVLTPVMAIHDQLILLLEQRMKRVRHPERWS
jgi:hypothetical protein